MIDVGGDHVLVPGLEEGQDLDQVPGEDQDPVLVLVAAILGQDQGLAVALVLAPGQGQGQDQGLGQSLQWKTKNQGLGHQVKKNQDLNLLWKLRMEEKKGSVQNLAQDQDQSLVLSQDLVAENVQHLGVGLDLKVLSKTVNLLFNLYYLKSENLKPRSFLLHILKNYITSHV